MKKVGELDAAYFGLNEEDTTLAYWVLASKADADLSELSAELLARELTSQCDAEDQASSGDDDCLGHPQFFQDRFFPIAPVQFVDRWSPFPYAAEALGEPISIDLYQKYRPCAAVAWSHRPLGTHPWVPPFAARERQFAQRFHEIAAASFRLSRTIWVVAKPGWDYSDRKLSPVTRAALKRHGFQFTTRGP